jgi:hypothetical protein
MVVDRHAADHEIAPLDHSEPLPGEKSERDLVE